MDDQPSPEWREVGTTRELRRRRKVVVDGGPDDVVVWWHDEGPYALRNICVHADRELAKGNIFGGRLICPGHQWGFDLQTGLCRERERSQPVYRTRIDDDIVWVDVSAPVPEEELSGSPDGPERS